MQELPKEQTRTLCKDTNTRNTIKFLSNKYKKAYKYKKYNKNTKTTISFVQQLNSSGTCWQKIWMLLDIKQPTDPICIVSRESDLPQARAIIIYKHCFWNLVDGGGAAVQGQVHGQQKSSRATLLKLEPEPEPELPSGQI